jgi:hypothetical protein
MSSPSRIFIVPYRDRQADKERFLENMKNILGPCEADPCEADPCEADPCEAEPYEIYFSHQCDVRPFNRGAMKNIGFLAMKEKYPDTYKTITFIFHDVDTWPSAKGLIDYNTVDGVVKHFYGFKFALGGMFAIKGADFEKSKGFPNFWGWGIEDNLINDRCLAAGLIIDRSQFYDINDKRISQSFDGYKRIISKRDSLTYKEKGCDDLSALKNMNWTYKNEYINVHAFDCNMNPSEQIYQTIDIRTTKKIIVPKAYAFRRNWQMFNKAN